MSEEADNKEPTDSEDTRSSAERRKRRRKWSGLRVPSDNVPRRADDADSGGAEAPVEAPSREDPHLAVSVAYSFSEDERSGPVSMGGDGAPLGPSTDARARTQ